MNNTKQKKSEKKPAQVWTVDIGTLATCPLCGVLAICELPKFLKDAQPDDTTHVCHPSFGGCNHGFAK